MKFTVSILFALTAMIHGDEDSYRNRIIQIIENPINANNPTFRFLNPIAANGSSTAPEGVETTSVFQLWTLHETTGVEYLLDEKTVSSYHPQAEISITSLDPYETIPRTRVDSPFNVTYNVSGIVTNDPEAQEAAKSVVFDHRVIAYRPGETSADGGSAYTTQEHSVITKNGETEISGKITKIVAPDLTQVRGEEIFSIFANPDFGVVGASLLASARVQIWPIASGSISGVDSSRRYALVPEIKISTVDLYPVSNTYLRYYKTDDPTNEATSGVVGNYSPNTVVPQSRDWSVRDLDSKLIEDGEYTVELLHETVFNTLRLGSVALINVDRTIRLQGGVISAE